MSKIRSRLRLVVAIAVIPPLATGCFSEPPDPERPAEDCDHIGIRDLLISPPTPVVGTEFELQWTRVGASFIIESGPEIDWIGGNADVTTTLENDAGLVAEVVTPFDYSDFGNGQVQGEFSQPEAKSVAEIVPAFADLAPGNYTASVLVVGSNAPVCPPQGTSNSLNVEFEIGAASTCAFAGITFLDLAIRDLTVTAGTTSIEWSVDYLLESENAADPGSEVTLDYLVTVRDASTDDLLGSTTVSTNEPILPGESTTETLQLMTILSQPPQAPVTIRVEVVPDQGDAECSGPNEDLTENNAIELTTEL